MAVREIPLRYSPKFEMTEEGKRRAPMLPNIRGAFVYFGQYTELYQEYQKQERKIRDHEEEIQRLRDLMETREHLEKVIMREAEVWLQTHTIKK